MFRTPLCLLRKGNQTKNGKNRLHQLPRPPSKHPLHYHIDQRGMLTNWKEPFKERTMIHTMEKHMMVCIFLYFYLKVVFVFMYMQM